MTKLNNIRFTHKFLCDKTLKKIIKMINTLVVIYGERIRVPEWEEHTSRRKSLVILRSFLVGGGTEVVYYNIQTN